MKIAILRDQIFPDSSIDEQDNKMEADFAEQHLFKLHIVKQIEFDSDLSRVMAEINDFQPDVVFNLVESVCKNDALAAVAVQLLEAMNIPFTGNKSYAQVVTSSKSLTKKVLLDKHIPTPAISFLPNTEFIFKADTEHASIGLDDSCVRSFTSAEEMNAFMKLKKEQTGHGWMAEQYVDGREFNCAFLGDIILPPAELRFDPKFSGHKIRTYEAKWNEDSASYSMITKSFEIESEIVERLKELTILCKERLVLDGYARIDFRMDRKKNIYVIDVNTNPCISPDSGFISMVEHSGMTMDEMFEKIIEI